MTEQTIPAVVEDIDAPIVIERFEDVMVQSLEQAEEIQALQLEIKDLISTAAELEQLSLSIRTHGITTSLMSFANRNNILTNHLAGIPSLESLTADISVEDSNVALESIQEALKAIYKKTIGKIAAMIGHVITSLKIKFRSVPAMRLRVDNFVRDISGKEFNAERAHKITGRFPSYSETLELMAHATDANNVIMHLLKMEIPTTEDAFVKFKQEVEALKTKYEPIYRIGNNYKYSKGSEASLSDRGYTAESFHVIAAKIDEYIRETLSSENAANQEWYGYEEKVNKVLESMSAEYRDADGISQTVYTKLAYMIMEVTELVSMMAFDIDKYSYRDGPVRALSTLSKLKEAYT